MAKGFGWVGRVDWVDAPPMLSVDVRELLDTALDWFRFLQMKMHLLSLVPQYSAMFHPINPATIADAVSNPDVVVYWANAHGDQKDAILRKMPNPPHISLRADQHIQPAMADRGPMKFAFLIHSEAMITDPDDPTNNWSYFFRKGQESGTVVIGVRWTSTEHQEENLSIPKMSAGQWLLFHLGWMVVFFDFVRLGFTFKEAFDKANSTYPDIAKYTVFNGDSTMTRADLT